MPKKIQKNSENIELLDSAIYFQEFPEDKDELKKQKGRKPRNRKPNEIKLK